MEQVGLEHPKPTTAMDCAGRYTTQGPTKRVWFLEEIQWWHDWWKNLHVCTSSDIQKHFYNILGVGMSTSGPTIILRRCNATSRCGRILQS